MPTVMIVDDELDFQRRIAAYLAEEHIAVLTALTNRDAVTQLDNKKEQLIDLILVNCQLPDSTETGYFPIKPLAKTQEPQDAFLKKDFTKKELIDFVYKHI